MKNICVKMLSMIAGDELPDILPVVPRKKIKRNGKINRTDLLGRVLTSHEHARGYMRHTCKGHEMGCLWLLLLKPKNRR